MSQLSLSQIVWWTVWVSAVGGISLVCSSHWLSCQTAFIRVRVRECEVWSVKCDPPRLEHSCVGAGLTPAPCSLPPAPTLLWSLNMAGQGPAGPVVLHQQGGTWGGILYCILWIESFFLAKKNLYYSFLSIFRVNPLSGRNKWMNEFKS